MKGHGTLHILTQYLWPDDAPTGIYAEQVADAVADHGVSVRLVSGEGRYRDGRRPAPRTQIERVDHFKGCRGRLGSTAREYESVRRAFGRYISMNVHAGDIVVITSAPPTTIFLERSIRQRRALGVYWLQDFYPQLVRGVWDAPAPLCQAFSAFWTRQLTRWHRVVKAAGNLGYNGENALVIRNWHTLELGEPRAFQPKTALYSGNLGYGHHLPSFLALCQILRDQGFQITVRGDGPGMSQLPNWVQTASPLVDPQALIQSYWDAEQHLVAGHPMLGDAVFPSKFWNARATGRAVLTSGFVGASAAELDVARTCDFRSHLSQWTQFLLSLLDDSLLAGSTQRW